MASQKSIFLFVRNFKMIIVASGTLATGAKFQYLYKLLHGEVLRQFEPFSSDV